MNKVITINLGGNAYQLEEGGFDALRAYLETAAAQLKNNPDRDEILLDIERAIADKFRALLSANKNVVEAKEVNAVIAEMGPVDADTSSDPASSSSSGRSSFSEGSSSSSSAGAAGSGKGGGGAAAAPKRLYRITDGAMIAGVCNGIGAYFNVDPTFIRIAFAFSLIMWGAGLMLYIVLAFVIPEANTPEEKAAACGDSPPTAEEFIRRAKEGYYKAMKGFPDSRTRRKWARQWKWQMRAHSFQWHYNWQQYWRARLPVHPAMGITLPILSVLQGATTVLWLSALISLLAKGNIFGMSLPASVPVWGAALFLFLLYGIVIGPMKAARRAYYWSFAGMNESAGTHSHWVHPIISLVDIIVGIIVAVILLCLAIAYFPELKDALQSVPNVARDAVHGIKSWWHGN
jgi:phage shock protein PspC (stress-responsive transcriptional regulator)